MRLIMEFELLLLSIYLVKTESVEWEKERSKASAMSKSRSLWAKWNRYEWSQSQSLMLKSPVITQKLQIFASVFFRYFEADWLVSE